jgi:energy-coupling factor transporter ATP-binding protein EcfA2
LIDVRGLTFQYVGATHTTLDSVDLEIKSGEIVLIAGHSGSGKSTLLRAINGLIPHQHAGSYSGKVIVDGLVVSESDMSKLATRVGYIFQNPENQIFMFSVERDVAFGLENLGLATEEIRTRVDWALDLLKIKHLALRAPHELSDGQKQRVAIAGVIAMRPKILILDEPTSLLDPFTANSLVNLVRELRSSLGMTVLIVEHRLDLVAKICDRLVVIDKGSIIFSGSPREVLSKADISVYGVTEPAIVKLAKILSKGDLLPLDPLELSSVIRTRQ